LLALLRRELLAFGAAPFSDLTGNVHCCAIDSMLLTNPIQQQTSGNQRKKKVKNNSGSIFITIGLHWIRRRLGSTAAE